MSKEKTTIKMNKKGTKIRMKTNIKPDIENDSKPDIENEPQYESRSKEPSFLLDLIMIICTGGLWLIWLLRRK